MKKSSKVLLGLGSVATIAGAGVAIYKAVRHAQAKQYLADLLYEPEMPDEMKYSKNNFIKELNEQGVMDYIQYPDYEGNGKDKKAIDAVSYYLNEGENNLGAWVCRVYHNPSTEKYEVSVEIDGMTYYGIYDTEDEAYKWLYQAIFETDDEEDLWGDEYEDA